MNKTVTKLSDLEVYICWVIINHYFNAGNQNYVDVINLSINNAKIYDILKALENLDDIKGLFDNCAFHIPLAGLSDEVIQHYPMLPTGFYFNHRENRCQIPYVANILEKNPAAIDKATCGFWSKKDVNKIFALLKEQIIDFVNDDLDSCESGYSELKKRILNYIKNKYNLNKKKKVYIKLNDPELANTDVVRTLTAMSFENTKYAVEGNPEFKEKLLYISKITNRRKNWATDVDNIELTVVLSKDLVEMFESQIENKESIGNDEKVNEKSDPSINIDTINNLIIGSITENNFLQQFLKNETNLTQINISQKCNEGETNETANHASEVQEEPSTDIPIVFPKGLNWKDITLGFSENDNDHVHIKFIKDGKPDGTLVSYKNMGFKDNNSSIEEPKKSWELLRLLAEYPAGIDKLSLTKIFYKTQTPEREEQNLRRQISELRKILRRFFNIDSNPFHVYKSVKGYKLIMNLTLS